MALDTLVRRNYGGKLLVSIKCHNLHSLKEVILLCQSILETRQISHLFSSAQSTFPLKDSGINCHDLFYLRQNFLQLSHLRLMQNLNINNEG